MQPCPIFGKSSYGIVVLDEHVKKKKGNCSLLNIDGISLKSSVVDFFVE